MQVDLIAENFAFFRTTKNPLYLAKAAYLVTRQARLREAIFGLYCTVLTRPSKVKTYDTQQTQTILKECLPILSAKDCLSRDHLIQLYGQELAVKRLPLDFFGARIESIVYQPGLLIMGEYGSPGKKIAVVTPDSCVVSEFYCRDHAFRHIHAIAPTPRAGDYFVTTGDSSKVLDLWSMKKGEFVFTRRLRKSLAGYTAIHQVGGSVYFGSDFSNRPNYLDTLEGERFMFPEKARRMFVIKLHATENRYLVALSRQLSCFGGCHALSIFDTRHKEFVYCDFHTYTDPKSPDPALHRAAISARNLGE